MEPLPGNTDIGVIRNLLNSLILLQSHLRLYGPQNANVAHATDRMMGFLASLLADQETVTVFVARHAFMFEDGLIDRNNRNFEKFATSLFAHGIAALTLHRAVSGGDLHHFLQLVSRRPAETWDEGGMAQCLRVRQVAGVSIREMAENDFLLTDALAADPAEALQHQRSRLWENFAMALLHGQGLPDSGEGELSPEHLAEQINRVLEACGEDMQQTFGRDASRFLISLKHEKIRIYRAAALHNLTTFVNNLTPELRRIFLDQSFALNLDADLAEGFLGGLSDQAILEALHHASLGKGYVPPVALKLLGRLAQERSLAQPTPPAGSAIDDDAISGRVKELFKADDFDKYVPKAYQNALQAILHREALPVATTEALEQLKGTLEPGHLEQHLGDIVFDILNQAPDDRYLEGFRNSLLGTLRFCQSIRNYTQIGRIHERCREGQAELRQELETFLASPEFAEAALTDLPALDPRQTEALWAIILAFPEPFVEPLLERLGTENNRATRLGYLKGLIRLGANCVPATIGRLADPRWFVVRNMLYLLRELGAAESLPEVRKCLRHPHLKVQQEALRTCLIFRDEKATASVLQALDAKNSGELVSAINLASLSRHPRVSARLLELLQSGTLLDYQLEVKKAAVRALASNAQEQCLPLFAELLAARNLLHARAHEQLKLEIIAALAGFPATAAWQLLQPQANSSSAELARAAHLTLSKLAGANP